MDKLYTVKEAAEILGVSVDFMRELIWSNSIDYINQMESINRNLSGLNTIYEIQLKSLSSQIDAIDKVNNSLTRIKEMYESSAGDTGKFREETEKMSQQLSA